ncbi:MAG TPA: hypothetical protein VLB80_01595 [Candidatus Babeliales bacterium]|nr:hypothetical protein [Candidatus Babeliales bacterium]
MIEHALVISLPVTGAIAAEKIKIISEAAFKAVESGDYEKALEIIILGMEQFPHDFSLQLDFAALLGDHSENFNGQLKSLVYTI